MRNRALYFRKHLLIWSESLITISNSGNVLMNYVYKRFCNSEARVVALLKTSLYLTSASNCKQAKNRPYIHNIKLLHLLLRSQFSFNFSKIWKEFACYLDFTHYLDLPMIFFTISVRNQPNSRHQFFGPCTGILLFLLNFKENLFRRISQNESIFSQVSLKYIPKKVYC